MKGCVQSKVHVLQVNPKLLGLDEGVFLYSALFGVGFLLAVPPGLLGFALGVSGWLVHHGVLIRLSKTDVHAPYKLVRYVFGQHRFNAYSTKIEATKWLISRLF